MQTLIDFHSHILPGVDDGSRSVAESIEMLRMEAAQGVGHVLATPHFYAQSDSLRRFFARRAAAMDELQRAADGCEGLPTVELGAEVHYFAGMSDSEVLSQLTIGGKECILIEMPPSPWTEQMYRELEWIYTKQGLVPVIAHLDRYIGPFVNYRIPQRLAELPVVVQANASFFLSRSTQKLAVRMLRKGQIHVLGSDCHNLTDRPPNLDKALRVIKQRLGNEIGNQILERMGRQAEEILGLDRPSRA